MENPGVPGYRRLGDADRIGQGLDV